MKLFIISLIPVFIYVIGKSKKAFHMLQQNYYNDDNRYLKWIFQNKKKVFLDKDLIFILFILLLGRSKSTIMLIFVFIYTVLYFLLKRKKVLDKKPLVVTARVKRMLMTFFICYFLMTLFIVLNYNEDYLVYYYMYYGLLAYLDYFFVMVVNFINKPVEKCVYFYYRFKAIDKLKSMNIPVIGITGSYGKTSSKNIINDILNVKLNSFATPKSFNTPYGLMNSINNYLDKFNDTFIAEMGAFKIGEIKQNCKLVHPKYGIITTIGEAHLETFGSRDNIMKGKFELIESLPSDGVAILNGDDPYQLKYELKNDCKVLWIGIDNKDVDLYATNIKMTHKGTTFDCVFKGDKKKYKFETKLLGKHNIYNILDGIMLAYTLGLSIEEIQRGVKSVSTIEHRLELKKYNNKITLIDDAYNSNPVGSKRALEVLSLMPGKKIIVTPGMIELGREQYNLNYKFGEYISHVADVVILVGETQTKPIQDALKDKKYPKGQIFVLNDVREAFPIMNKLALEDTFVLLENDLPDLFNE